jgi:hypothetical protein
VVVKIAAKKTTTSATTGGTTAGASGGANGGTAAGDAGTTFVSGNPGTTASGAPADPTTGAAAEPFSLKSIGDTLLGIAKNPMTYETIGAQMAWEALLHNQEILKKLKTLTQKSTQKLGQNALKEATLKDTRRVLAGLGVKIGENASEKAVTRGIKPAVTSAEKAAIKAATRVGAQAITAAETGPAAPFVEIAEMAFNVFTGAMDGLNLGGFQNMSNMTLINGMKKESDAAFVSAFSGQEFPVIMGPKYTLDPDVYQSNLVTRVTAIYTAKIADIQSGWANGTRPKLPAGSSQTDYENYFNANIDMDACFNQAEKDYCGDLGGVYQKHPTTSNMHCSFTKEKCVSPWPMQGDATYYEWNSKDNACEVSPSMMRSYCEGLGLGVTYNQETGSCNLSDSYCRRYGADQGVRNGDCSFSKGQQIAEMIFGTAFTRSIVNVFDPHNYAGCPPGSQPAKNLTAGLGGLGAAIPGNYNILTTMLCESDSCPGGQEKMLSSDGIGGQTGGFCYDACKPKNGTNYTSHWGTDGTSEVAGMCYAECPNGWVGTAGVCTLNPQTKTSIGTPSTCPPGTQDTGASTCQNACISPNKMYGGLCYLPQVNTSQLVQVPSYSCPNGGTNTGLLCTTPLECTTNWCPSKIRQGCCLGPFWYICSVASTSCSGGGTTSATASCNPGYKLNAGMCYAVSTPLDIKSKIEVGVCPEDQYRNSGLCYPKCPPGWEKTAAGTCQLNIQSKIRDSYSREPTGIAYKVFPRPRNTPFPSTSQDDFKNSAIGSHIQQGINAARNGDLEGLGKAVAGTMIVANPAVLALQLTPLADLATEKAGLKS